MLPHTAGRLIETGSCSRRRATGAAFTSRELKTLLSSGRLRHPDDRRDFRAEGTTTGIGQVINHKLAWGTHQNNCIANWGYNMQIAANGMKYETLAHPDVEDSSHELAIFPPV